MTTPQHTLRRALTPAQFTAALRDYLRYRPDLRLELLTLANDLAAAGALPTSD